MRERKKEEGRIKKRKKRARGIVGRGWNAEPP